MLSRDWATRDDDNAQEVAGLQGLLPQEEVNQEVPSTTDSVGASLSCTHSVRGHEKDINCVTLSPNDALLFLVVGQNH